MALATKTGPQAELSAPIYVTDHKPLTVMGRRPTGTLALDAGETIDVLKIPKGARILDAWIVSSAVATTTAASLGLYDMYDQSTYHADEDGLIDACNLNTSIMRRSGATKTAEIQLGVQLDWDCYVRLTITTGDLGDAIDVYVFVTYIMP